MDREGNLAGPPPFTPSTQLPPSPPEAPPPEPVAVEVPAWQTKALRRGRRRMRVFANHLVGYLAVTAFVLPVSIFHLKSDVDRNFLYLVLFSWLGIMALHATYAMRPIMENQKFEKGK